jgi:hypothetical protein
MLHLESAKAVDQAKRIYNRPPKLDSPVLGLETVEDGWYHRLHKMSMRTT